MIYSYDCKPKYVFIIFVHQVLKYVSIKNIIYYITLFKPTFYTCGSFKKLGNITVV